jgi:hypothetical protein
MVRGGNVGFIYSCVGADEAVMSYADKDAMLSTKYLSGLVEDYLYVAWIPRLLGSQIDRLF